MEKKTIQIAGYSLAITETESNITREVTSVGPFAMI